jgi:hypothetical protein
MSLETVARTIQFILAPVVMVTSCAILVGGLLQRYAAINDRMRLMTRERFDLLRAAKTSKNVESDVFSDERLREIDHQLPDLLRRHKRTHDAVLAVYSATIVFIADMFVIALAAALSAAWAATAALIAFLCGTAVLFSGVVLTALEVRTSHLAVAFEVRRVTQLQQVPHEKPQAGEGETT